MRPRSTIAKGGRQAMWERLRRGPASSGQLVEASGSAANSVYAYMHGLAHAGYVAGGGGADYALVKDTGGRAPSIASTGTLYDWNLNPPMKPAKLAAIWKKSKLSMTAFGEALGMGANAATRLRQMMDGSRPISPAVEEAAGKLTKSAP